MSAETLLEIAVERTSAINTYWNIFIAVATGALGILASGKEITARPMVRFLMTAGFLVFALSNLDAILNLNRQREALVALLSSEAELDGLVQELKPYAPIWYIAFHAVLDVVVIGAIWAFPRPKLRSPSPATRSGT